MACLITENGKRITVLPFKKDSFTLEEMQALVGGGLVERVPLHNAKVEVWCNEEGLLKSMKYNLIASTYVSYLADYEIQLVGPVVVFDEGDTDPNWSSTGVTEQANDC